MNLIQIIVLVLLLNKAQAKRQRAKNKTILNPCQIKFHLYSKPIIGEKCTILDETNEKKHKLYACEEGYSKTFGVHIKYAVVDECTFLDVDTQICCIGQYSLQKQYDDGINLTLKFHYTKVIGSLIITKKNSVAVTTVEVMNDKNHKINNIASFNPTELGFWKVIGHQNLKYWLKGIYIFSNPNNNITRPLTTLWFRKLQHTHIEEFQVHRLPIETMFSIPHLPHLKRLVIQDSTISKLSTLFTVPKIEELQLMGNNIEELPQADYKRCKNLRVINLSRCNVHYIYKALGLMLNEKTDPSLRRHPRLEKERKRHLSENTLQRIFNPLEELNLSYNPISHIKYSKSNPFLPVLKILNLSHCVIEWISERRDPFENMPSLRHLDLSANRIVQFESVLFFGRNIDVIDFSENLLTSWPMLDTCEVNILNLCGNQLSDITNYGKNDTKVNTLNIFNNNVSEWKDSRLFLFSETTGPWIQHINISENKISYLSEEMLKSLQYMKSIDLGTNPIDCAHCSVPSLQNWLLENSDKVLNMGYHTPMVCDSPAEETGRPVTQSHFYSIACNGDTNLIISVGSPIVIIVLLVCLLAYALHRYRFDIVYMKHLLKLRGQIDDEKYDGFIYDAFISYSGKDRPFVIGTLAPLIENGEEHYKLCLHDRDFLLGSYVVENIMKSIKTSRKTLLVLSNKFINSKWCQWETDMANYAIFEENRNFLILIELESLDRGQIARHLKVLMDTRTYLKWPKGNVDERVLKQTRKRLTDALGKSIFQENNPTAERGKAESSC